MVRVATYRVKAALDASAGARDASDHTVTAACIRVREGWLLGRQVDRTDPTLVVVFA